MLWKINSFSDLKKVYFSICYKPSEKYIKQNITDHCMFFLAN